MSSWFFSAPEAECLLPDLPTPETDIEIMSLVEQKMREGRELLEDASLDGWEPVEFEDESIRILELKKEGDAISCLRAEGAVSRDPDSLLSLLSSTDIETIRIYEEMCMGVTILREVQGDIGKTQVIRRQQKAPGPISNRELVVVKHTRIDEAGVRWMLQFSINVRGVPESSGFVRAVAYVGIIRITPQPDGGSYLARVGKFDPRGSLPKWVLSLGKKMVAQTFIKFRETTHQ